MPATIWPPSVTRGRSTSGSASVSRSATDIACPRRWETNSIKTWLTSVDCPDRNACYQNHHSDGEVYIEMVQIVRLTPRKLSCNHAGGERGRVSENGGPKRYRLVADVSTCRRPAGGPLYKIRPPWSPGPGPTSTIQSAWRAKRVQFMLDDERELPDAFKAVKCT